MLHKNDKRIHQPRIRKKRQLVQSVKMIRKTLSDGSSRTYFPHYLNESGSKISSLPINFSNPSSNQNFALHWFTFQRELGLVEHSTRRMLKNPKLLSFNNKTIVTSSERTWILINSKDNIRPKKFSGYSENYTIAKIIVRKVSRYIVVNFVFHKVFSRITLNFPLDQLKFSSRTNRI